MKGRGNQLVNLIDRTSGIKIKHRLSSNSYTIVHNFVKHKLSLLKLLKNISFVIIVFALAFTNLPELIVRAALTYYDDVSGSVAYSGSWVHSSGWPKSYNGTVSYTNSIGANALLNFSGSRITRVYNEAYNRGRTSILIDGSLVGTYIDNTSTSKWQVLRTWTLTPGSHSIKTQAAGGGYSDLDAFIVDIQAAGAGRIYDNSPYYGYTSPYIKYIGNWTHGNGWSSAYQQTVSWSNNTEDAVTFTFWGFGITWYFTKANNRGIAAVSIDGVDKGNIDLYSPIVKWKQLVSYDLEPGIHTIHISVTGMKNNSSSDYYVDVDALVPMTSVSRYQTTTDLNTLYQEGCNQGKEGQTGTAVLDFGQPWYQNSKYGTLLLEVNLFRDINQIKSAVEWFMAGYWDCSPSEAHLLVAVGMNNYGYYLNRGHGEAWGQLISDIDSWIDIPPSYRNKLSVGGAVDIEALYNTSVKTRDWIGGYSNKTNEIYYNFGSCDSCPYKDHPNWTPANGWTQEDIWSVSYGSYLGWPYPEIYNTQGVNASQWQFMSLYSYTTHGYKMAIKGPFTTWQGCQGRSCTGIDNTPTAGWTQLYNELNSDTRTAQEIFNSSDITWEN